MLSRKPKPPDPTTVVLQPLEDQLPYKAAVAELAALENRLAESREQRKRAIARAMGAKPGRSAVERAKLLVAGGKVDPTSPADDRLAADIEINQILLPAICEATAKLDEVCRELNYEASLLFKPLHEKALVGHLPLVWLSVRGASSPMVCGERRACGSISSSSTASKIHHRRNTGPKSSSGRSPISAITIR